MRVLLITILLLISGSVEAQGGQWIKRADFGGVGRHRGTGIDIGNRGYFGLGHYNGAGPNIVLADWWEYDPATNAWTQKADYIGNGPTGSYAVLAFGMQDAGYVGGGQVASNTSFWKYDPSTNMWTQVAPMPTLSQNTEGFVIDGKGYYLSGSTLWEYDSAIDSWSMKSSAPGSIGIWPATFVIDGKGYVKSGYSLWEYKPTTDSWATREPFPGSAGAGSVGFSQNNRGFIICGYSGWLSEVRKEVWQFNPGTNTWDSLPEFPGTARRFAAGFQVGNRAFFGIGTNGTNFADLWEFSMYADLEEMFDLKKFTVFPNPAVDQIAFHSENLESFEIIVFDEMGRKIEEQQAENHIARIPKDWKKSGLYHYQVLYDHQVVHTGKFIFK
jgi:N-acetylneuraminic acid mutarotase